MKTNSFIAALFVATCLSACGSQNNQVVDGNSIQSEEGSIGAKAPQGSSANGTSPETPQQGDEVVTPPTAGAPASHSSMYDDPGSPVPPSSVTNNTPAPTPASADLPLAASVTVESQFDKRLGLVHISWSVQGGNLSELYLYSNGFNRLNTDGSTEDPCGAIDDSVYSHNGKRRLLLNSTSTGGNLGEDLNEDSPAHVAVTPYLEGADECGDSNCRGYTPARTEEGKRSLSMTPVCRIDLKDANGTFVTHGSFYSRVLVKDAVFHLYAKTADGSEASSDSDAVEVPQTAIENITAAPTASGMTFTIDYIYGIRPASVSPAGCTIDATQSQIDDRQKGRGRLVVSCPLTKSNVRFTAYGIGSGNHDSRPFAIALGAPVIEKPRDAGYHECSNGSPDFDNCKGQFTIEAKAYRSFTITDLTKHTPLVSGKTGIGATKLTLVSDGNDRHDAEMSGIDSDGKPKFTFKKVTHDYQNTSWHAEAVVGGNTISSEILEKAYPASFNISANFGPTLNLSHYDVCDNGQGWGLEGHCGYCVDSHDIQIATSLSWEGRHISRIDVSCNRGDIAIGNPGLSQTNYEIQTGPITAVLNAGNMDDWATGYHCTVTAFDYLGNPVGNAGALDASINCHSDNSNDQNFQPDGRADPDSENNGTGYTCPMLNGVPLQGCQS